MVCAHRVALATALGRPLSVEEQVDHVCHAPLCVNPRHLRVTTNQENATNRAGAQANNRTSGIRGVSRERRRASWCAQVMLDGRHYRLGYFAEDDLAEAAWAARHARDLTMPFAAAGEEPLAPLDEVTRRRIFADVERRLAAKGLLPAPLDEHRAA